MALIAKETLKIGFITVALPGNVVEKAAVDEYGWHDKVEDDGNGDFGGEVPPAPDQPSKRPAKKKQGTAE